MQQSQKIPLFGNPGSVVRRLAVYLVFISTAVILLATAVQSYINYREDISSISSVIKEVSNARARSLSANIWNYSENSLLLELDGILNRPGFEYIEVISDKGEVWTAGEKIDGDFLHNETPLVYLSNGKNLHLGTLSIWVEKPSFNKHLKTHILTSLLSYGTWVILFAFSLFFAFRHQVTRHLYKLANYTSSITLGKQFSPLSLDRDTTKLKYQDEIGIVVNAINTMQNQLAISTSELRESEAKLSHHIMNTPLGSVSFNNSFEITEWNKAAEIIFGFTADEVIGLHVAGTILPFEIKDEINEVMALLIENKGGNRSTNENLTKGGRTIICDWYNTPILGENGEVTGISSLIQDVTERKIMEENLNKALVDAERANQSKSEFLASMSHELRTPLNAILGFSDILSNQYFGPPGAGKYREYATDIHRSGEHLLELINDILDISSIEAGKTSLHRELLTIEEVIEDCKRTTAEKAVSKDIEFVVSGQLTNTQFALINVPSNRYSLICSLMRLSSRPTAARLRSRQKW
mgnify:FL=1